MNFDEFKEKKDEIKDQLEESTMDAAKNIDEISDEISDGGLDFDAVIDISIDGTASVSEKDEVDNDTVEIESTEAKELYSENETKESGEEKILENETAETESSDSSANSASFEEKINKGYDTVKGIFSGIATKLGQKADELQAKEKVGKLAETVSDKFSTVVKNVENKFNKSADTVATEENIASEESTFTTENTTKAENTDKNENFDTAENTDKTETNAKTENTATSEFYSSNCSKESTACNNEADELSNENTDLDDINDSIGQTSDEVEKVEGVVVGSAEDTLNVMKHKVASTAKTGAAFVVDAAKAVAPKVKEATEAVVPKIKETAQSIAPKVKETAQNLAPKVKETAQNIGPKVVDTAKSIGPKLSEVVKGLGPKVKETAENVAPKVKKTAKDVTEGISFQGYRIKATVKKKIRTKLKEAVLGKKDEDGDNIRVKKVKRYSSNFMNHTATIIHHRHAVIRHCVRAGIPLQGLTHDLSKFSPSEFRYGVKYFRGNMSPNEGEREAYGYSNAWMHHKGRNKHHFEYWTDYNIQANKVMPVKMPLKYVIEMFCDRVAAGKIYKKDAYTNSSPYEYFDKGRSRRTIHQETSDFLEKLLKMLATKGEGYTFMYIKWYMKHHKDY